MKTVIEIDNTTHARLKKLAGIHGLPVKQTASALLDFVLPQVESGKLRIAEPKAQLVDKAPPQPVAEGVAE